MTPQDMACALHAAGFEGVTHDQGTLFARLHASAAEFQATADGRGWRLSFAHPVRAPHGDIAAWNALHPDAPIDIYQGETRMVMRVAGAANLMRWRGHLQAMTAKSLIWRRLQRQGDEGM